MTEAIPTHKEHACHGAHKNVAVQKAYTNSSLRAAAHATLHCLIGCIIGELAGLIIGVSLGFHPYTTMTLSIVLAYISGFSLTVFPLMKRTGFTFRAALRTIWLGEAISIGVMELVMNSVDYHMGGMSTGSILSPLFWQAIAVAIPAGYIAAFPVNFWLIGKELKKGCH